MKLNLTPEYLSARCSSVCGRLTDFELWRLMLTTEQGAPMRDAAQRELAQRAAGVRS